MAVAQPILAAGASEDGTSSSVPNHPERTRLLSARREHGPTNQTTHTSTFPSTTYGSELRSAFSEELPEDRTQEVFRSPYWTPGDLRRAADNYNDD